MRNVNRMARAVVATLAAGAATLAFGAGVASALTWSGTYGVGGVLKGELSLELGSTGKVATCDIDTQPTLTNNNGHATWRIGWGFTVYNDCVDHSAQGGGQTTTLPLGSLYTGTTASSGGALTMTMQPTSAGWAQGPFAGSSYFNLAGGSGQTFTATLVNGNATSPTKVIFDDDAIGTNGVVPIRATGSLDFVQPIPFQPTGNVYLNP